MIHLITVWNISWGILNSTACTVMTFEFEFYHISFQLCSCVVQNEFTCTTTTQQASVFVVYTYCTVMSYFAFGLHKTLTSVCTLRTPTYALVALGSFLVASVALGSFVVDVDRLLVFFLFFLRFFFLLFFFLEWMGVSSTWVLAGVAWGSGPRSASGLGSTFFMTSPACIQHQYGKEPDLLQLKLGVSHTPTLHPSIRPLRWDGEVGGHVFFWRCKLPCRVWTARRGAQPSFGTPSERPRKYRARFCPRILLYPPSKQQRGQKKLNYKAKVSNKSVEASSFWPGWTILSFALRTV